MKIGYACICLNGSDKKYRTCTMKFASEEKLREIIAWNLRVLEEILYYNIDHHIALHRISSDLIPFGSSPVNAIPWQDEFQEEFERIGALIKIHDLRVSLHPGQYSVLNSPRTDVVERTIEDLRYHASLLDLMKLDASHKLILHVGGVYGNKQESKHRFITQVLRLDPAIQRRLTIENDDRYYHIGDVMNLAEQVKLPVIFDTLHHTLLPPDDSLSELEWLDRVRTTWKVEDGMMKIHYSEQAEGKRRGAHAATVSSAKFVSFLDQLSFRDLDIMLEVKDKNLSACKCIDLKNRSFLNPEETALRYRYLNALQSADSLQNKHPLAFYEHMDTLCRKGRGAKELAELLQLIHDDLIGILDGKEEKRMEAMIHKVRADASSYPSVIEALLTKLSKKKVMQTESIYPLMYLAQREV